MSRILLSAACVVCLIPVIYASCFNRFESFDTSEIDCKDVGWNDGLHPGNEAAELARNAYSIYPPSHKWWLTFTNCSFPDRRLDLAWFTPLTPGPTVPIESILFSNNDLEYIEPGAFGQSESLGANIRGIGFTNSPLFTELTDGMLEGLRYNEFRWSNGYPIQRLDNTLLVPVENTIVWMTMTKTGFSSAQVVANLTGICATGNYASLQFVHFDYLLSGYGIPVLGSQLFTALNKRSFSLTLIKAGVNYLEDSNVFDSIAAHVNGIFLSENNLRTIPEGTFDSINELSPLDTVAIYLDDNPWHCDCHLQYVQDVFTNKVKATLVDYPECASPPSQAGKRLLEADMSTECEPLVPPPKLNITC